MAIQIEDFHLVKVTWRDAVSHEDWTEDILTESPYVFTVGYLLRQDEESITVTTSITTHPEHYSGQTLIPTGMIVNVEEIDD